MLNISRVYTFALYLCWVVLSLPLPNSPSSPCTFLVPPLSSFPSSSSLPLHLPNSNPSHPIHITNDGCVLSSSSSCCYHHDDQCAFLTPPPTYLPSLSEIARPSLFTHGTSWEVFVSCLTIESITVRSAKGRHMTDQAKMCVF